MGWWCRGLGVLTEDAETIPMFNMVNHPHHGVDVSKYGAQKTEGEQ